ncbi:hypothetical protein HG263_17445 [Pseudoalteromonas sp. JBTF-M23]|uniref:Uncharacterized protein n=1 Tax=Pseudoalteromonas caenipelagi TaxID=2726988 RepID=A0A849VL34_9GAMM|nr:hypothetical protein [Pseudoalteromonas caenipelagi]NOU52317.1 hypothetical protein [Pseudoalteromonas caenipelagi]
MSQRKIIILLLILSCCVLLYFITSKAEQGPAAPQSVNDTHQVSTANNPKQIPPQLSTQSEKINQKDSTSCEAFERAQEKLYRMKFNFVGLKAIGWYFEGTDKHQIAQALTALYGYDKAMMWVEQVNGLSRYHEKHTALMQRIDELDYDAISEPDKLSLHQLGDYRVNTYTEHFDFNKQLNLYPDVELTLWLGELSRALYAVDFQRSLSIINKLQKFSRNQLFFEHPLRNSDNVVSLSAFAKQHAQQLFNAMFALAPVYLDDKHNSQTSFIKQTFMGINRDQSSWRIKEVSSHSFEVAPGVQKRMDELVIRYSGLQVEPNAADICAHQTIRPSIPIRNIKTDDLNTKLGKRWQVIGDFLCPKKSFVFAYVAISSSLNNHQLNLDGLKNFETIMANSAKLKAVFRDLDGYESTVLFEQLYAESPYTSEQINTLIEDKVTPLNSDFYAMLFRLPIEQQKQLLVAQQYNLKNTNPLGFSLITQVLEKDLRRPESVVDELIPFLISQGVSLVSSENDVDPLWFKLQTLNEVGDPKRALPFNALSSLIEHTQLNDTHIDAMYKIKRKHEWLYNRLIEHFPKLDFDKPDELIEIECTF